MKPIEYLNLKADLLSAIIAENKMGRMAVAADFRSIARKAGSVNAYKALGEMYEEGALMIIDDVEICYYATIFSEEDFTGEIEKN